jgi:hypothetical protein
MVGAATDTMVESSAGIIAPTDTVSSTRNVRPEETDSVATAVGSGWSTWLSLM